MIVLGVSALLIAAFTLVAVSLLLNIEPAEKISELRVF
jgi:hypothetical protein